MSKENISPTKANSNKSSKSNDNPSLDVVSVTNLNEEQKKNVQHVVDNRGDLTSLEIQLPPDEMKKDLRDQIQWAIHRLYGFKPSIKYIRKRITIANLITPKQLS